MADPLLDTSTKITPQGEQARPEQVQNNAGGYSFVVSASARLHRFLTLGTEGGTYYVRERSLTRDNAGVVAAAARDDAQNLVKTVTDISLAGRAPRNKPALYALAAASAFGDEDGRRAAFGALPHVARTGTHLYNWAAYRELFAGWGRGARRAVADWYLGKDPGKLAYQLVKYRQRDGWTHRDLLRLAHPEGADAAHGLLFDFACGREKGEGELPQVICAFNRAWEIERDEKLTGHQRTRGWVKVIEDMDGNLPWEALPGRALASPDVWRALIEGGMPMTALLRKLPVITNAGVLEPMSAILAKICGQLTDQDRLLKARVHPVAILLALRTYAAGHSMRGDSTWTPVPQVTDALNDAFYLAYGSVEPAGKRTMLALDVSGSMGGYAAGTSITCREASAAIALVTAATEPATLITGFTSANGRGEGISGLNISPRQRLDDAVRSVSGLPFGGTDCSLPMTWAMKNGIAVDTFQVYTDNETWAGRIHPHQALEAYRQKTGTGARLAVVAMTPDEFTIADPDDPGSMDVAGFDSAVPQLLADFSRGSI